MAAKAVALECVERLEALGHYRFNYAVGETCRLANAAWWSAEELRAFLTKLTVGDPSGDVYAALAITLG